MKLHELIRDYRKSKGISQMHISKVTGISNKVISDIENGVSRLRAEDFLKICKALEIEPNFFMDKPLELKNSENISWLYRKGGQAMYILLTVIIVFLIASVLTWGLINLIEEEQLWMQPKQLGYFKHTSTNLTN